MVNKIRTFLKILKIIKVVERGKGGQRYDGYSEKDVQYMKEYYNQEQYILGLIDTACGAGGLISIREFEEIRDSEFCEKVELICSNNGYDFWKIFLYSGRIVEVKCENKQNEGLGA